MQCSGDGRGLHSKQAVRACTPLVLLTAQGTDVTHAPQAGQSSWQDSTSTQCSGDGRGLHSKQAARACSSLVLLKAQGMDVTLAPRAGHSSWQEDLRSTGQGQSSTEH